MDKNQLQSTRYFVATDNVHRTAVKLKETLALRQIKEKNDNHDHTSLTSDYSDDGRKMPFVTKLHHRSLSMSESNKSATPALKLIFSSHLVLMFK